MTRPVGPADTRRRAGGRRRFCLLWHSLWTLSYSIYTHPIFRFISDAHGTLTYRVAYGLWSLVCALWRAPCHVLCGVPPGGGEAGGRDQWDRHTVEPLGGVISTALERHARVEFAPWPCAAPRTLADAVRSCACNHARWAGICSPPRCPASIYQNMEARCAHTPRRRSADSDCALIARAGNACAGHDPMAALSVY